jgi:flavin reductase (DIM6/NTAB) family NADH-FMN oxidoreductase RutF
VTDGRHEHLVFLWTPAGYTIESRLGAPPAPGAAVVAGERRHRVTKVAASPLPGDPRACAYLLPLATDDVAETAVDTDQANGVPPPDPEPETAQWRPVLTLVPDSGRAHAGSPPDVEDVKTLLEGFPQGAAVVSVEVEGRRLALTVGSLVPLGDEPLLLGFTIPSSDPVAMLIPVAGRCTVSILAGGQEWLARQFDTSKETSAPLTGVVGSLACVLVRTEDFGPRTLAVCEVRDAEASADKPSLMRVRNRYEVI